MACGVVSGAPSSSCRILGVGVLLGVRPPYVSNALTFAHSFRGAFPAADSIMLSERRSRWASRS
eukprot:5013364-Pyramimonas_sp.AAC.1